MEDKLRTVEELYNLFSSLMKDGKKEYEVLIDFDGYRYDYLDEVRIKDETKQIIFI